MDEALLALNKEQVREKEMKDLKKNVRVLKRRRQALTDRENKIQEDINRGEFGPFSSYKLPLAVSQAENKKAATTALSEEEIETLRRTAVTKQKLQAVAICYGVTSIRDEAEDETVFMMDPYIAGKPYGPYNLRLRLSRLVNIVSEAKSLTELFAGKVPHYEATLCLTLCLSSLCSASTARLEARTERPGTPTSGPSSHKHSDTSEHI